jgi:hypothetical protein
MGPSPFLTVFHTFFLNAIKYGTLNGFLESNGRESFLSPCAIYSVVGPVIQFTNEKRIKTNFGTDLKRTGGWHLDGW